MRQKYQKRGGFRNAPSTSEGSALREPRAMQSNGVLAYALPSAARRQTPARCCTRCPAYAPAIKSPARYSAGRAKQHNHARNVKPFPPRGSPRRAVPAALSGPRGLRCWGKYPGAFPRFSAFSPGRRGAGSARCLVRPGRSALPETVPRGEAIHISAPLSLGSARCLFRPIFLCCSLYHAPGLFPCLFIFSLAGPARRRSPARFLLAKKGRIPVPLCAVV